MQNIKPKLLLYFSWLFLFACESTDSFENNVEGNPQPITSINPVKTSSIVILGTCQDAGSPHINCQKKCCATLKANKDNSRLVVSLGIVDTDKKQRFLIEASPNMNEQISDLHKHAGFGEDDIPDGIFVTHAHIGHYTGLMQLGKEGCNAQGVKVMAMPKMVNYLSSNGPWDQLVNYQNIKLIELNNRQAFAANENISITPIQVPHRDEYSETVGFQITGPNKSALFIPDIDKWDRWEDNIVEWVAKVDYLLIDGTFYDENELDNRNMNEIPHPFVVESMSLFDQLSDNEKDKIYFIHINHSNPLLNEESAEYKKVISSGYHIAKKGDVLPL
ncbi:MBL fold metallo-hydrolase [Paracrocinitomix mangrovi]|uniref:MBL fold metallo-hydrolase n=1 Tax=Paracrocinitomix mangrovi TaxID=2862509 RepID=UPI001EDA50CA|nr:MBL fold metallo-hydrolase [Paracrocinitomix mangrovi]UKN01049.1 MBL fold metallo-hydrolase [Paracrocinitomix mangrovi]